MAMNQSCYGISGRNKIGLYLTYLKVKKCVDILKRNTHGAVFDTITKETFNTVSIINAPATINARFERVITPTFEFIKNNLNTNSYLTKLHDTLLPKLLSGELTLPEAEKAVKEAKYV
ncbi:hypothetical protein [Photorhabdus asymbiotica]|uniref:hypothetical protein n=1 Tax=Photorhabdus asymbiotica TaxID=291112 RepID=UPI003DA78038